jgi:hypothetical protein
MQARTIDLCNNPKTKEPKLSAARRIIAEWPQLDREQADFTASVDQQFKAQEAAFAAVDAHAGGSADGSSDQSPGSDGGGGASMADADSSSGGGGSDHSEL